jgi:hypothetical protein
MQLKAVMTERDKLAGQAMSLATVLGATTCTPAAQLPLGTAVFAASGNGEVAGAGAAIGGDKTTAAAAAGGAAGGKGPTPAQLKELGQLMQRLTKENAALIRARYALDQRM